MDPHRRADGSAGDADYGRIGTVYSRYRRPDPRIAVHLDAALGTARTVLNVGAGTGSYEPADRDVTPVEPSAAMRDRRPPALATAIDATAESLPFPDDAFDAAMTTFSAHQWPDLDAGLAEMRRVTRGPVLVLTGDPARLHRLWLTDYVPELLDTEARRYPTIDRLTAALDQTAPGHTVTVHTIPIPLDCVDGFTEAYYGRPEGLLDPDARLANSAWSFVQPEIVDRFAAHLRHDLDTGGWDARHGHLRTQPTYEGSLVLVVSTPAGVQGHNS